ncbi:MAG: hypothetical protein XD41_0476 [Desulfonauticus sp. 38_4375]|nr:MAG: hypothetical protein XD41_0476 [Desulfonauticus sp. 38_4375]
MSKNKIFKFEQKVNKRELASFLRDFADNLEKGNLLLKSEEEEVILELPEMVKLEIEVSQKEKEKGIRKTLELEVKWY